MTPPVEPELPADAAGPVTTTVTRRVKPGHEPFYEQFLEGIIAAASRFPGHLGGEVAELRARGVQLQELPELGTVDGVADLGFALAAWFIDPYHNWLGLLQFKEPGQVPDPATQQAPAAPGHRPGEEP